jgi:hypothetical protein
VFFTTTTTGSQLKGRSPASSRSVAKQAIFDSISVERVHRVWNEDTGWFHVMDIELTGGQPRTRPGLLPQGSFKLLFNQSLVNGYNLKLEGQKILLPVSAAGYLLVSFGDASLQVQRPVAKRRPTGYPELTR